MLKRFFTLSLTLLIVMTTLGALHGQDRGTQTPSDSLLTMKDAILHRNGKLSPQRIRGFAFLPERDGYSDIDGSTLRIHMMGGAKGSQMQEVGRLELEGLNGLLTPLGMEKLTRWPSYEWVGADTLDLWCGASLVRISRDLQKAKVLFTLPKGADNVHTAPDKEHVQYNLGQRIEIMDRRGERLVVTSDTAQGIVNGREVHRNEFGIDGGIFWSPDGRRLAFYRMDESMVTEYPLVDATTRVAQLNAIRYPMAGMASHRVTLAVYDLTKNQSVWVQKQGGAEDYLTNVTWSADGETLYIVELNRAQNHLCLNRFSARTGGFEGTLLEERSERYVEPLAGPHFIPGGKGAFLWESQRSGHNHLYRYDAAGKLKGALTQGAWDVIEFHGFSHDGKNVYITSTEYAVLDRQLYEVPLSGRVRRRLTDRDGVNSVLVESKAQPSVRFASFWSSGHDAGGAYIVGLGRSKGSVEILRNGNPLESIRMPRVELVSLTAADGKTPLYGRLIRPERIAPGEKLPTVVYVYGGPHAQLVTNSWMLGAAYWELLMAQRGYVIFVLDNRGSAGRGFTFEQATHRQLGEVEMADQMKGVEYLKGLSYVDPTRMGVHGWSFGGFMTISLFLRQGDTFRVGVAGGPVTDWQLYEVMYGERYMGTPADNPEGYSRAALPQYAKNLKGRHLLLLHGYQDPVVVPQHALQLMKAFVDAGEYTVDSFWYVGHPHNVRGWDRIHLMDKVTDYFDTYLKNRK